MKKIQMENILKSKGYVSIEALIVTGLIITSGSFMVSKLAWKGKDISVKSNNSLNLSKKVLDDNNYNSNNVVTKIKNNVDNTTPIKKDLIKQNKMISVVPESMRFKNYNPIIESLTDIGIKDGFIYGTINTPYFGEITAPFEEGTIGIIGYVGTDTTVKIPSEINGKPVTCVLTGFQEEALKSNNAKTTIKNNEELLKYLNKDIDLNENERLDEKDVKNCIAYIKKHGELKYFKQPPMDISNAVPMTEDFDPFHLTEEQKKKLKEERKAKEPINSKVYYFMMKYQNVIPEGNYHIKKVVFPDSIISINNNAFRGITKNLDINLETQNVECKGQIEEIVLGKNMKDIGDQAFIGNRISKVTVPKEISNLKMGYDSFMGNELTSNEVLKLLNKSEYIYRNQFKYNDLTDLEIPNNVKSISEGAFCNNKIKNVIVPKNCSLSHYYEDEKIDKSNAFDENVKIKKE